MTSPKVFISYAWESDFLKQWVKKLATELRSNGIDVKLDQWEVIPGDQMPHFMEKSVKENDYVLIICTPKYKIKSEERIGGVGYEGDIMTAEVLQTSNHRKFIPIIQSGNKGISIPFWMSGKYFIDLSDQTHFDKNFEDLITTILNVREKAPEIGQVPSKYKQRQTEIPVQGSTIANDDKIKIKGILTDEVTQPRNDGTPGSGLYRIPFSLNKTPNRVWIDLFVNAFNRPREFSSMHRGDIASVYGNKIYLDGTTIEEVERYHKKTLKSAVETANEIFEQMQARKRQQEEQDRIKKEQHRKNIDDINKRMNFDD